ncbi:Flavin-containing monooxygenase [Lasiodiplodia theobromae]|uniref:Flavin-containing monooxygenase n=1 Tax=Lasiodiplodia theobromae TaxID=45133 RepID=UPI0015C33DF1|nr:Flavin-containing monooxygenase [Lasiodiplodia theobromae]KAF4536390.1 Flavin-containing monooxygenase [Lasiodiplodia theobromae]
MDAQTDFDVVIIGAGISGINAAYRVQTQLPAGTSYTILEARDNIGGTWDLFKYPGIRSDSDLYTFGFPWRPWMDERCIAEGPAIVNYMKEAAASENIDSHIQFRHKLQTASWSSELQKWRLDVIAGEEAAPKTFYATFLIMGTGYYDYDEPLSATIPGIDTFAGQVVHPQFWPSSLDYANRRIVIIGSGATAITLLPNLASSGAAHVTMLQRSPSYIVSQPLVDGLDNFLRSLLPAAAAFRLIRWRYLLTGYLFYFFCRACPALARRLLRSETEAQLRDTGVPFDPHFNPSYDPWDQRVCACPDADFFAALRNGKASVVTDTITNVTPDGIALDSGESLPCDIIVTATGLKMRMGGGARIVVDGREVRFGEKLLWRGALMQDVPNAAFMIGYTNASWTLGADAAAQLVTRVMRRMRDEGATSCVPRVDDSKVRPEPFMKLNSGYVNRALERLPKAGDKGPWKARWSYFSDLWNAKVGDITRGLEFRRVSS